MIIENGTGNGYKAEVDDRNQLSTKAVVRSELQDRSSLGDTFIIGTSFVNLTTTASFNGMLYVHNTENYDLVVHNVSLAGDVTAQWQFLVGTAQTAGGTLVTDEEDAAVTNANSNSNRSLSANAYEAAANGKTITGLFNSVNFVTGVGSTLLPFGGAFRLRPGGVLAISCKPSASGNYAVGLYLIVDED